MALAVIVGFGVRRLLAAERSAHVLTVFSAPVVVSRHQAARPKEPPGLTMLCVRAAETTGSSVRFTRTHLNSESNQKNEDLYLARRAPRRRASPRFLRDQHHRGVYLDVNVETGNSHADHIGRSFRGCRCIRPRLLTRWRAWTTAADRQGPPDSLWTLSRRGSRRTRPSICRSKSWRRPTRRHHRIHGPSHRAWAHRLFLQFAAAGKVHTAEFTMNAT